MAMNLVWRFQLVSVAKFVVLILGMIWLCTWGKIAEVLSTSHTDRVASQLSDDVSALGNNAADLVSDFAKISKQVAQRICLTEGVHGTVPKLRPKLFRRCHYCRG